MYFVGLQNSQDKLDTGPMVALSTKIEQMFLF